MTAVLTAIVGGLAHNLSYFYHSHLVLTTLVFFPLLGVAFCLALRPEQARWVALGTSLAEFGLSLPLFWTFRVGDPGFQNVTKAAWIRDWGIAYAVGVDGISLLLILLTTFLTPLAILSTWEYVTRRTRAYYAMMLLLLTGMVGVFVALDMFLFYVFWEIMLVPMYFIIGVWGHERRIYAAMKFILYTALGSLLMLVAIVGMFWLTMQRSGAPSFAYLDWLRVTVPSGLQLWLFLAFALAFAIKVPLVPFHTWLPDAHVEAPTAGSVILAGVLLKMGVYGFLRFAIPFFPNVALDARVAMAFLVLALLGILYAAWVAAVQPDAKKLIAYTSVAHLGFIMVGLFAMTSQSVQGGILQSVNHGISTGALFILAGFLYERRHTREIAAFGGLAAVVPLLSASLVIVALSSIGLPSLNGFVGEFLILLGAFRTHPWVTVLATLGVVFAAYYLLPMVRRIVWNPLDKEENRTLRDLSRRELAIMLPLVAMIVLLGVYPRPFLDRIGPSADAFVTVIRADAWAIEKGQPRVAVSPPARAARPRAQPAQPRVRPEEPPRGSQPGERPAR
ncbi:MAG: NADH-quinone oxidoreductase subunit M [Gemmatimonadetes bacterium]|nr:NADH-quinone oxidoreductase subunit M [Gemmatimonadota bacterium]